MLTYIQVSRGLLICSMTGAAFAERSGAPSVSYTHLDVYTRQVSKWMGHANISTTYNTYIHALESERAEAERLLEAM